MSIASEITRLQTAKSSLKTKLNSKNDAQHQITDETIDEYPDFVDSIPTGGSTPTGRLIYSDFDAQGLPQQLEYVPLSPSDTKFPDRFCSYGHQYTAVTWNSKIKNIICPDHITEIGVGGFAMGGQVLKKISNYDKIKVMGNNSFAGDISRWDYDYLPPNLEYIGNLALSRAPLADNSKFQIPDSVYYIGESAFIYQSLVRRPENYLHLPSSLVTLGNSAFNSNGFQLFPLEIEIPQGVETIGKTVFGGSAHLTTTITFKGTPTSIDAAAFTTSASSGSMRSLVTINVPWSEGEVANAPWGAVNATINYNYGG